MNSPSTVKCEDCGLKFKCVYNVLNKEQKILLNSKKLPLSKKKENVLYYEGDPASTFFMIRGGLLKHVKQINADEQFFGGYRKQGELAGLASYKSNMVYNTSAVCITDVSLCAFPNYLMIPIIRSNHLVAEYFFDQLADSLKCAGQKIFDLIKCPAINRLAKTLLFLDGYLMHNKSGMEMKREELAFLTGMSRETLSRQLANLKKQKLIALNDHHIKILQPAKLEALCACK